MTKKTEESKTEGSKTEYKMATLAKMPSFQQNITGYAKQIGKSNPYFRQLVDLDVGFSSQKCQCSYYKYVQKVKGNNIQSIGGKFDSKIQQIGNLPRKNIEKI